MHIENLFLALSGKMMMDAKPIHVNGFARFLLVDKASFRSFLSAIGIIVMHQGIHRFYRLREVTALVGLSRATIYRLIKLGTFPSGVSLTGNRAVGWSESDLAQWMNSRLNDAQ